MKLFKEHREEFCHIRALGNVPKWDVKENRTNTWVHIEEQPSGTKNYTLLTK